MTDGDTCGAECVDGSACQHPADNCPIPSHSDPDADNPQGQPSKFTDERAQEALHAAGELGKSKRGCGRDAGVSRTTIDVWLDTNPTFEGPDGNKYDFFDAFVRARGDGETYYIKEGRDPDGDVDSSFAKFMLASSYKYKETEKTELEHSGEVDRTGGVTAEFIAFTEAEDAHESDK
jgi:hypothetical protein